jgi:flagellar P-ring protein precursor FlgI
MRWRTVIHKFALLPWLAAASLGVSPGPAPAATSLSSICRIKGQEENVLQGLGIMVGLKGTGDGGNFLPTIRSLAAAMQLMGDSSGKGGAAELKDAKNVALVTVSAIVPAAGVRQGDRIDCTVASVGSAKSLVGGRLFLTPLMGPVPPHSIRPDDRRVYALAEGPITIEDASVPTTGRIHGGCRLEEDFNNVFVKDGKITLVLNENHAEFQVAEDVAELINGRMTFQAGGVPLAKALNQVNVEVVIPRQYLDDPVLFVSQVLNLSMTEPQTIPRVTINERTGSIVIGGDVDIGAVVVTHKNITVETGAAGSAKQFVPLDPGQTQTPRLKALVESLNAVHVPPEDVIDIIKCLDRNGKLHAQLVIQ